MKDEELRQAGLKVTGPRLKILKILEEADPHHLTAEDVYKLLLEGGEDVGLATVYRVLTQFQSAGLVQRHNFEGGRSVFELESEAHHDHLVCVECGKVIEFVDEMIESRQRVIAQKAGFEITDHDLTLYGICLSCKQSL